MLFSKLVLFTLSFVVISVLATPHALRHHALHRRVVTARVAHSNSSNVTAKRRSSPKCAPPSAPPTAPPSAQPTAPPPAQPSESTTPPDGSTPSPDDSAPPSTSLAAAIVQHSLPPVTTPTFSPTSTHKKPSTTSTATPPGTGSGGGDHNNGGSIVGQGTFYGTGLGACGITNKDTDFIAAVATQVFDNYPGFVAGNPNTNPICNKQVEATAYGKTVIVSVVDRCQGCEPGDLDFSPEAFKKLADFALGRIPIQWRWI